MTVLPAADGNDFGLPEFVTDELEDFPSNSETDVSQNGEHDVAEFLTFVARHGIDENDQALTQGLDALCRKISVQKTVRTSYDSEWRLSINPSGLDLKWWPLMLFTLLGNLEIGHSQVNKNYGLALKRLNSAFAGIDLAEELGLAESKLAKIRQLAEQRLQQLTS